MTEHGLFLVVEGPVPVAGMPYPESGMDWAALHRRGFRRVVRLHPGDYDPQPLVVEDVELEDLFGGRAPRDAAGERARIRQAAARVAAAVERGEGVVVHCVGGTGRTGTVLACALQLLGRSPDEALAAVRAHRPHWPESPWHEEVARSAGVPRVQLSPVLANLAQYPFARLDDLKEDARRRGIELIDFGMGDPREVTPSFIREALVAGLEDVSSYPRATGLPELRAAIARWIEGRFGVTVDAGREIVPTLGSKEAIFSFAQVATGDRRLVAIPEPAYPVYERGALFAGAEVVRVPLSEETGWLPDLDAFDAWDQLALFWTCYQNNPTGATAPLAFYEELAERAREHGFLVCSDEAYSELWFDEPPVSALQVADRDNVVVFNTLSKRSSMTGYRSGFVCASAAVSDALRKFRPTVGTAPQEFVQRAAVAAWSDERHVDDVRALYRRKRDTLLPVLLDKGLRLAGGEATFYLWVEVGESEPFARRLLEQGIVVAPGSFFGPAGEGYARFALVPTQAECERAAAILEEVL